MHAFDNLVVLMSIGSALAGCTMHPAPSTSIKTGASTAYDLKTVNIPPPILCTDIQSPLSYPEQVACSNSVIDGIDEQIAFLISQRLKFAAIAAVATRIMGKTGGAEMADIAERMAPYSFETGPALAPVVAAITSSINVLTAEAEKSAVSKDCI